MLIYSHLLFTLKLRLDASLRPPLLHAGAAAPLFSLYTI